MSSSKSTPASFSITDDKEAHLMWLMLVHHEVKTNWKAVAQDLNLNDGAVSKRWSRLKQAMADGKDAGPTAPYFIKSVFRNTELGKGRKNWATIGDILDIKPSAAAKRYSRLTIAMKKSADKSASSSALADEGLGNDNGKGKTLKTKQEKSKANNEATGNGKGTQPDDETAEVDANDAEIKTETD